MSKLFHATTDAGPPQAAGSLEPKLRAVHNHLFEQGLEYFFPGCVSEPPPRGAAADPQECDWLGSRRRIRLRGDAPFAPGPRRIVRAMMDVLTARYETALGPLPFTESAELFRGLPEDRYVSAFLDPLPYRRPRGAPFAASDRIVDAIEVLRLSAMTSYENRRTTAGVILSGCRERDPQPDALPYAVPLTASRSFHRLSDGLRTLALVDPDGKFTRIVDIGQWSAPFADIPLAAPVADRYAAHSRATSRGGHICMVLTATGEIKVFADGCQAFAFRDGRWRLVDAADCCRSWQEAVGNADLAARLFAMALNLAEDRRGALFLALDRHGAAAAAGSCGPRRRFDYLVRDCNVLTAAPSVIETIARIDGAVVVDHEANVVSFGVILKHAPDNRETGHEGARSAAALSASNSGAVLKVSEDGMISCLHGGRLLWEL